MHMHQSIGLFGKRSIYVADFCLAISLRFMDDKVARFLPLFLPIYKNPEPSGSAFCLTRKILLQN